MQRGKTRPFLISLVSSLCTGPCRSHRKASPGRGKKIKNLQLASLVFSVVRLLPRSRDELRYEGGGEGRTGLPRSMYRTVFKAVFVFTGRGITAGTPATQEKSKKKKNTTTEFFYPRATGYINLGRTSRQGLLGRGGWV